MDADSEMNKSTTAEGVLELIEREGRKIIPQLFNNWKEIGYDQKTIAKFGSEIVLHTQTLLEDMLVETQSRKARLLKNIEVMVEQISTLEKELDIDSKLDYKDEPLVVVEDKLRVDLNELQKIKEERLLKYKHLLEKEHELCQVLGTEPVGLDKSFPSEQELQNFNNYLLKKEEEMIELKQLFVKLKNEIIAMNSQLSYEPTGEFEKLVCNAGEKFVYSKINMIKLQDFHERLRKEINALKELADSKRQELITLWNWLDVSKDMYKKFLEKYSGFDTSTLTMLNKEIKQCKEVRKENMAKYIKKVRQEIVQWWDTCHVGQAEREAFRPFHYETFNEDTLAIHEMEVQRLKAFYEKNAKIYEVLKQESEMWNNLKVLMLREDDPNRFNNRGGQLLEEEKQRKFINKTLPKIGEKLQQMLDEYEEEHGKPFLIDGLSYEDFRGQQIKQFTEEKENIKVARARAKDEKKSAKKTPLSASRRNLGTTLRNVRTSVKRKILTEGSPSLSNSKKRMVASEKSGLGARRRKSGQLLVARRRLNSSLNSSKRSSLSKKKTPKKPAQTTTSDTSNNLTPYEEFQNGLADRDELRSTLVSNEVLKVAPQSLRSAKTPVRTPAKPLRKRPGQLSTAQSTPRIIVTPRSTRSPKISHTPRLTTTTTTIASSRDEHF